MADSTTTATQAEAEHIISDPSLAEEELLDELEYEEIPAHIREARIASFKKQAFDLQQMKKKQHGSYTECKVEKEFLDITTGSERCLVHFYHKDFRKCEIMDAHLKKLADKYFEVKFAKINVDIAKFFVTKLMIRVLPAVFCFKGGFVVDKIIGFDELGNTDEFQTEVLERRLGIKGFIDVKDLDEPERQQKKIFGFERKNEESDSEDDW